MSIKGLTDRAQLETSARGKPIRLGRLNKGKREGWGKGAKFTDFTHFRFTPYGDEAQAAKMNEIFTAVYGQNPTVIEDVRIPADIAGNFFIEDTAWLFAKLYSENKPPILLARSNGEWIKQARSETNGRDVSFKYDGEMSHEEHTKLDGDGNACFVYKGRLYPWQRQMKLDLILTDFNRALYQAGVAGHGVVTLQTSSLWDISNLIDEYYAIVDYITSRFHNPMRAGDYERVRNYLPLQDIPLRLYRSTDQITTPAFKTAKNPNPDMTQRYKGERSLIHWQVSPKFAAAMQDASDKKAENLLIAIANAPLLESGQRVDVAALNDDLFGNAPAKLPAEAGPSWEDDELWDDEPVDEIESEVVEGETTTVTQAGEDWHHSLLQANTLDEWAYRAYQTDEGKLVFTGAPGAKKWYTMVIGNWQSDTLPASLDALVTYAHAIADEVAQSEALDSARKSYQTSMLAVQDELPF